MLSGLKGNSIAQDPSRVRIRAGQPADMPACVDLVSAWNNEHDWLGPLSDRPRLLAYWKEYFARTNVWVAEAEGRIVGFCLRDGENIGALYVAALVRRCGIGKRLLDRAKDGCDRITVWAYGKNVQALKFYRREGLVEVSREVEEGTGLMDIEHRWTAP